MAVEVWHIIGTAGGTIAAMAFVIRGQNKRIEDMEKKKVDRSHCEMEHRSVSDRMERGDRKFDAMDSKLDKLVDHQAKINTSLAVIAEKLKTQGLDINETPS